MLPALYVVNAALLVVHEIDSASWREWELFRIPGGEPAFILLHLPLVAIVVWGYGRVTSGARSGASMSLLLATAGIAAAGIHAAFLAAGRPEFRTPISVTILAATFVVSVVQAALAIRALRTIAFGSRGTLR